MNEWRVAEALASVRRLMLVLDQMTDQEIVETIALEERTRRRQSLLDKLYRQHRVLMHKNQYAAVREQAEKLF